MQVIKVTSQDEVKRRTLEYFFGDELATNVWMTKYALQTNDGEFLESNPDDMHRRLASEFARLESRYGGPRAISELEIYELLKGFKYIVPQGSPMYGIGNPRPVSLSNCVVIAGPEDNMSSIVDSSKSLANLAKRRCGVGVDLTRLRPEGLNVNNSAKTTSGAWSFADFFSYVCRMVGQAGRRGALMISMDIRHPDALKFITMKADKTKVTGANVSVKVTDAFMEAVEKNEQFKQQWPVDSENPTMVQWVDARELWKEIVWQATHNAEPGLLFWDQITSNLPAHCYPQFKTESTNPCFHGDTLISVADGRNAVSIRTLAEEGRDVPVYSVDPVSGKVSIKMGRNPRVTGYDKDLVRIHLDNGAFLDVTPDHKFPLRDGSIKFAKDLRSGDSLMRFTKLSENITQANDNQYFRVYCNALDPSKDKIFEHRLVAEFCNPEEWVSKYDENRKSGWVKGGLVVHHKDYNSLNNAPENLEIMTFKEHNQYHADHDNVGENNGRYSGFTNEDIETHAISLTKELGRRFSKKDWQDYAGGHGIPKDFSSWRTEGWFNNPTELAKWAAVEAGLEYIDEDPRLVRTWRNAIKQGYSADIVGGEVLVKRCCEGCRSSFNIEFLRREQAFCSLSCSNQYVNTDGSIQAKRVGGIHRHAAFLAEEKKQEQARVFSDLAFRLKRRPFMKEWGEECKRQNVSSRVGTKFGFSGYRELAEVASEYNHKVESVEVLKERANVYNITVDDNHTVGIVTEKYLNKKGNPNFGGVYAFQCGELPLSAFDACRLISFNLKHAINNPFTDQASFDIEKFKKVISVGTRLIDDLVDLELEKLKQIQNLADTEDEKELWGKLQNAAENGRRAGLGTHGLADCLARLGLKYDTAEGIAMVKVIYQCLRDESYRESIELAKERGAFPAFDWELEKNCDFIARLPQTIQDDMAKYGRRNISLLTCAPTGSVSVESQTSSGVEPVFKNGYTRRRKLGYDEQHLTADFVDDLGDRWQEYVVYHHNAQEYMQSTGQTELPECFVTSEEIDGIKRIEVQAAMQEFIDHSISSTINLPAGTDPSVVSDLYLAAWKNGLKGVTVYVDGSRSGVLITTKEKQEGSSDLENLIQILTEQECILSDTETTEELVIIDGVKLPEQLTNGPTQVIKREGGKYYLNLSYLSNDTEQQFPVAFWIHANRLGAGEWVTLNRAVKSVTSLILGSGVAPALVDRLSEKFKDDPYHEKLGKAISMALRHNIGTLKVIKALEGIEDDYVATTLTAVRSFLKKTVKDGTKAEVSCISCGSHDVVFEEGCYSCKSCGHSGCG